MNDWKFYRNHRFAKERPDNWPDDVFAISMEGLNLLGINLKTGKLYWDGEELATKTIVSLRLYEVVLATAVAIGTFGLFAIELGERIGWW